MTAELIAQAQRARSPAAVDNGAAIAYFASPSNAKARVVGFWADYSAAVASVKAVTLKSGPATVDGVLQTVTLSRGTTATNVQSTAFHYVLDRVAKFKAAVAAGTALPAGTIPADKWGVYLQSVDAAGTLTVTAGAANYTTGYDNEAAALAALPATPASQVALGHLTVLTAVGLAFVAGTDALEGGAGGNPSSDTNYYAATAIVLTEVETFRWDFGQGPALVTLPLPIALDSGLAVALELAASGAGGTTGRVTVYLAAA